MEILKDNYDKHFAIIIGINKYDNLPNLEYAVNDAKAIKDILTNNFNYKEEDIKTFYDKDATKSNIMDAYYELVKETCNNDSVLFFYAGHESTYLAGQKSKGFLVPTDGTEERLNTLLSWDTLINETDMMRAKHVFFIMDACYSGLALLRKNTSSKRFLKDMLRRNARQVLTAGKSDQTVKDSGAKTDNSVFTGYLIEALNGAAKTEQGVISANSVMNYVYNKVANDPKSRQTPGYGTIEGEGDFIFNYEELFKMEANNLEKDEDILVEVSTPNSYKVNTQENLINELKQLIADNKNYIKVEDLVNEELRIYLAKTNTNKLTLNTYNEESFIKRVIFYQESLENLLIIVVLLTYYGGDLYIPIICKILSRITPNGIYSGIIGMIDLMYYPTYLIYYSIILPAIEMKNIEVIKAILNLELNNNIGGARYSETNNLFILVINHIIDISSEFKVFYPEKNYKYPLNEYLYKYLQPTMDDIIYIGEEYINQFMNTELLISCFYAIYEYKEDETQVWGPLGRYTYQLHYGEKNIEKLPINNTIEKVGLYDKISNKKDFIEKYKVFLSKYYF